MENIENQLLREYRRGNKEVVDLYHEAANKMGLSDSILSILWSLCEIGEGCLQRDLCTELCMNKQTVNSAIRKMEKEELIYLTSGKGRDMHIQFTEKGKEFVEANIQPLIVKDQQAFLELTEADQKELIRISRLYIENLKKKMNLK